MLNLTKRNLPLSPVKISKNSDSLNRNVKRMWILYKPRNSHFHKVEGGEVENTHSLPLYFLYPPILATSENALKIKMKGLSGAGLGKENEGGLQIGRDLQILNQPGPNPKHNFHSSTQQVLRPERACPSGCTVDPQPSSFTVPLSGSRVPRESVHPDAQRIPSPPLCPPREDALTSVLSF